MEMEESTDGVTVWGQGNGDKQGKAVMRIVRTSQGRWGRERWKWRSLELEILCRVRGTGISKERQ